MPPSRENLWNQFYERHRYELDGVGLDCLLSRASGGELSLRAELMRKKHREILRKIFNEFMPEEPQPESPQPRSKP